MSSPVVNGTAYMRSKGRRPTICSETCLVDPYYEPKHLRQKLSNLAQVSGELDGQSETRLLVLYTGGTIGMKTNSDGAYAPAPNFMLKKLRTLPMFHDPDYPLPVYEYNDDDDDAVPFVMPLSKEGKRVIYQVCEYEPLLDSCNMTMTDWARLALDIDKNYDQFDGFVILHGTDTMAYTASALSFMLEDLGKPVVLTGAQIPIFETRSDGRDNFLGALIMAGHYNIPEVAIYFNNKLMRGNRTTKVDSGAFDAFNSPNLTPLARLEIDIIVNWDAVFRPASLKKFSIHTNMNPHVGLLRLFPSITKATVRAFLQPPMEGVVIQTYGAGNGPDSRKDLMEVFEEAAKRGVIIINITQCARGTVSASYAPGRALLDIGVIPGGDMTPEAALTKLSYALGKTDWSTEKRRKVIQENIRGEKRQIISQRGTDETLLELPLLEKLRETLKISSSEEVQVLKEAIYPSLLCAAAREGDIDKLKEMQLNGAQFNQADYDGRTTLHVAASEGHLEAVKYLLENGASVHARDRYGNSPLDDAVRFNHHEVIQILKQTGAHLTLPPYKLGTMLCNHLRERHHLTNIPDNSLHNGIDDAHYTSLPMEEDGSDDLKEIRSWYLAGADINQGDYDRRTALHVAVCHNNRPMVEYLLSIGAQWDIPDSSGLTALDEARKRNFSNIEEMLLNNQNTK